MLGGGREAMAPEYGLANLNHLSLQRLHYGMWLSRQTGAPMLFSGGVGHADNMGVSEAEIAARIAEKDYGRPLTWTETESRDTRENAVRSVAMLKPAGVTDLVLVTHGFHMPRAMRAFQVEAQRAGSPIRVWPAPMGLAQPSERAVFHWLPTNDGFQRVRLVAARDGRTVAGRLNASTRTPKNETPPHHEDREGWVTQVTGRGSGGLSVQGPCRAETAHPLGSPASRRTKHTPARSRQQAICASTRPVASARS